MEEREVMGRGGEGGHTHPLTSFLHTHTHTYKYIHIYTYPHIYIAIFFSILYIVKTNTWASIV